MGIYMKYGSIKGDATHADHKDWVEVQSLQFGIGRSIMTPVGAAQNRESSHPSISQVSITKNMDGSSYKFFEQACIGKTGEKCTIHLVTNENQVFAEYELENTLIAGYNVSTSGDRPAETISLNFTKIIYKYAVMGSDNKSSTTYTAGYDISTAKKV